MYLVVTGMVSSTAYLWHMVYHPVHVLKALGNGHRMCCGCLDVPTCGWLSAAAEPYCRHAFKGTVDEHEQLSSDHTSGAHMHACSSSEREQRV